MNQPVIAATGVGKRYYLSHQQSRDTLRESLNRKFLSLFRRGAQQGTIDEFWALQNIDFSIHQGDVVGVIGRNGAGKSTLLKILSRITDPTVGRVTIRGRVASLLEVGTGFHPELTGRENIFLNGAILGMTRVEILRKFDEIVAFAEVERFLDTQVKYYSSGMYVRLAFAVAAHLEPEILIVDEVLAVGDAKFQKKCLGKMKDVTTQGRTVLFVSHNTAALQSICRTGIWLQQGRLVQAGPIGECLAGYLRGGSQEATYVGNPAKPHITFVRVDPHALSQGRLRVEVGFQSPFPLSPPVLGITLSSNLGMPLSGANGRMAGESWQPASATAGVLAATLDHLPLHSDTFRVSVQLGDGTQDYDQKSEAIEFDYISPRFYPKQPPLHEIGPIDLPWQWSLQPPA